MRTPMRLSAIGLVTAALLSLSVGATAQQLQSEGVIYSFTQVRLGEMPHYALMPIGTGQVRPDAPLTSSIPTAFSVLRSNKPATYGNTSITFTDADAASGQVTVNIDPAMGPYFELIAAETVYTFTQLGIERVLFPGFDDDGMVRHDVPYAAYRMQVPLWQILQAGELAEADVMLPNGETVSYEDFDIRLQDGDPSLHAQILDYLDGASPVAQYGVLTTIGELGIPGYEQRVLPVLQADDPVIREAALDALATSSQNETWDAIITLMQEDPEIGLREKAAQMLAEAPNTEYHVYEIFYRARNFDPPGRIAAIGELASIGSERVREELLLYLADPDPNIALAAVDALTAQGAWDTLETAMNDEALAENVRVAAATSLANEADGEASVAGWRFRGFNMTGEPAMAAVDAINALETIDPRPFVEEFFEHPDLAVRIHTANVLGSRADREAFPALDAVANQDGVDLDLRDAARDAAYEIMMSVDFDRVVVYANGNDTFLKGAAYRALGTMAQQGQGGDSVMRLLSGGLEDADPSIRAASVLALSSYGTSEVLDSILTVEQDAEPQVQGAVGLAMGAFPGEEFAERVSPVVTTYIQSGEPEVIAGAVESMGSLGMTNMRPIVLEKISFPDPRVRAAAMRAAADLSDEGSERDTINAIAGQLRDEDVNNRVLAAQLLGQFNNELAVLSISQVANEPIPELRYAAIEALGRTGHAGASTVLVSILEDPEREIRLAALEALRTLNMRMAIPDLQAVAGREADPATVEAINETITHLEANGT